VVPTAILAASYGAAFLVGVGSLNVDADVILSLLISIVINSAFALFEEIGWRGYLLPHLAGVQRSAAPAVVGLLHGVWHLPLMLLTTAYNPAGNRLITVPVFLAILTGAGVIYGYLRSMSGSLWPVVIAHGTFNAVLGVTSTAAVITNPTAAAYLTGETGIFTLAGVLVAAGLLTRRHHRRPINRFISSECPRRPIEEVVP
jgi:membrane protease YdiL (CAAX protease family)